MSRKGGYIIADLKNTKLTSGTPATVPTFINPNGKAVLVSGLNIDGTEYPDMWVYPNKETPTKYENMLGSFEFSGAQVTYTASAGE